MHLSTYLSKNDLSDADFAAQIAMSKTQVWRLRSGKSKPTWETVQKIEAETRGKVKAADWFNANGVAA